MECRRFVLLCFTLFTLFHPGQAGYEGTLRFDSNGQLKVLQVTDTHYGEPYPSQDKRSTPMVENLIDWEKPDIVACTGDMITGYNYEPKVPQWFEKQWIKWTEPFNKKKQPYFYLLGNHDPQANYTPEEIMKLDMTNDFSMSQLGPSDVFGASNYVLPVYDPTGKEVVYYFWVFDSGYQKCIESIDGYDCIKESQIQWYRKKSQELLQEDGKQVPGVAFFHIPSPEFMNAANQSEVKGYKTDDNSCWSVNSGFFYAAKDVGNIEAFISGHDHGNDYTINYHGIQMIYGRKTGYGGYSPPAWMKKGGRVFEFTLDEAKNVNMTTWIRTEDGTVAKSPVKKYDMQPVCGGGSESWAFPTWERVVTFFEGGIEFLADILGN